MAALVALPAGAAADETTACPADAVDLSSLTVGQLAFGEEHWYLHIFVYDFNKPARAVTYQVAAAGGGWLEMVVWDNTPCEREPACTGADARIVEHVAGSASAASCTAAPATHYVQLIAHYAGFARGPVRYVLHAGQS